MRIAGILELPVLLSFSAALSQQQEHGRGFWWKATSFFVTPQIS